MSNHSIHDHHESRTTTPTKTAGSIRGSSKMTEMEKVARLVVALISTSTETVVASPGAIRLVVIRGIAQPQLDSTCFRVMVL